MLIGKFDRSCTNKTTPSLQSPIKTSYQNILFPLASLRKEWANWTSYLFWVLTFIPFRSSDFCFSCYQLLSSFEPPPSIAQLSGQGPHESIHPAEANFFCKATHILDLGSSSFWKYRYRWGAATPGWLVCCHAICVFLQVIKSRIFQSLLFTGIPNMGCSVEIMGPVDCIQFSWAYCTKLRFCCGFEKVPWNPDLWKVSIYGIQWLCDQHSPHSEAVVAGVRLELSSRDDIPGSH